MTAIDSHTHSHGDAGNGHHSHSEYPFLAHHFETPLQQFDSGKLGMWVFLATEILFFGALFALYAIMRAESPEVFKYASQYLDTTMGAINTCVLILSSLTMAMAVHFAQRSMKGPLVFCLFLTFLGACGFLVIKYFEYSHKIHEHLLWGKTFYMPVESHGDDHASDGAHSAETPLVTSTPSNPNAVVTQHPVLGSAPLFKLPPAEASTIKPLPAGTPGVSLVGEGSETEAQAQEHAAQAKNKKHLTDPEMPLNTHRFFGIYFAMTGLHGIHVVIGMFLIGWLTWHAAKGRFNGSYYTPVDLGGLYWHIVDLIWIFLFPLFYLIH